MSRITVVITQHEKQTYYKRATCRVFGFIALLSSVWMVGVYFIMGVEYVSIAVQSVCQRMEPSACKPISNISFM